LKLQTHNIYKLLKVKQLEHLLYKGVKTPDLPILVWQRLHFRLIYRSVAVK